MFKKNTKSENKYKKEGKAEGKIVLKYLETQEPHSLCEIFLDFCKKDIASTVKELDRLKSEDNRKHLQKLVYSNLVNKFDHLVDKLLLWSSINNTEIREDVLKTLDNAPIYKKEVFEIFFLKEKSYEYVIEKINDSARSSLLRQRHSVKLAKLLSAVGWKSIEKPRVNSDGKIFTTCKKNIKTPNGIIGYADWLYCRRNGIVHGDGYTYTKEDFDHLIKRYPGVDLSKNFKLQLSSITSATTYYIDFLSQFEEHLIKSFKK